MTKQTAVLGLCILVLILTSSTGLAQAPAATMPATATATTSVPALPEVAEQVIAEDNIIVTRLSNGLTVIIKPHRAAPVVAVYCYVHTGSMYEKEWLGCGLSHLTEHLVASGEAEEGNTSEGRRQLARRVAVIGGVYNAFTSIDWTNYHISAAAGKAMDCVDLVCEWMARPEITPGDFDREHGVVQRELEMGKDSPNRRLNEAHSLNVYGPHPAAVPVIGLAAPLRDVTFQDMLAYHKRMYVPGNMVFCVVGDIDAKAVIERIRRGFAGCEGGRVPDHSLPAVQPVLQVRRAVVPMRAMKEAMQTMSFQTVSLLHEDLYALDLLSTVLGEGGDNRLKNDILRDKKLVTSISSGSYTPSWGRGEFEISFRSRPDQADAAEKAILAELKNIVERGVSEDELARAKRQKAADLVESRQTVDSIARTLATDYLATGDVTFSAHYVKRIQAVTVDQIKAAAARYFAFDRLIVTRMVPAEKFSLGAAATQAGQSSAAAMFTLPNGLRVVLKPVGGVGLVSMALLTKGGLMLETPPNNGMGNLMTSLCTKGAGGRTAEQIAAFFDQAGGGIGASCGNNTFTWQATVLDDSFEQALDIFADCVIRPTYAAKELEIAKPIASAAIDKIEENWQPQLMRYFRDEFFKDCGPYAMLPSGNKEAVAEATPESLKEYHAQCLKGGDSVLAVFGQFDAAVAKAKIEKLFADVPPGKVEVPSGKARKVDAAGEMHVLPTKNEVAAVVVALPGMTIDNLADKFPIDVLDTIISGWMLPSGWLHDELRGKQLVYVVHAYNWPGLMPGAFITYAAGQPDKAAEVVAIIKKNLSKAASYKPTQEEIDEAVNSILTAELLGNQSMSSLAMQAGLDELYGFGFDFHSKLESNYRKVTPDDVLRAAKKYLSQGTVVTVTTPKPDLLQAASQPAK